MRLPPWRALSAGACFTLTAEVEERLTGACMGSAGGRSFMLCSPCFRLIRLAAYDHAYDVGRPPTYVQSAVVAEADPLVAWSIVNCVVLNAEPFSFVLLKDRTASECEASSFCPKARNLKRQPRFALLWVLLCMLCSRDSMMTVHHSEKAVRRSSFASRALVHSHLLRWLCPNLCEPEYRDAVAYLPTKLP